MKINDKNLCAFATSGTPVDREGWLVKRGEVNKAYQKRWFILKGNLLFYFDKKGDREPVGVIILEGCTIELGDDDEQYGFKIVFHGTGNRYYALAADSQESMEGWMKALACAGYDFMKMMVAELQRQLNDLDECGPSKSLINDKTSRQRHNPFNRLDDDDYLMETASGGVGHGHANRSQSMRVKQNLEITGASNSVTRNKLSFHKLHSEYGRQILQSRKYAKIDKNTENPHEQVLITL